MVVVEIEKTFKRRTLAFEKGDTHREEMRFVCMADAERWADQVNRNRKCEYTVEVLRAVR